MDGSELFYMGQFADGQAMMAAPARISGDTAQVGAAVRLFSLRLPGRNGVTEQYLAGAHAANGRRWL